MARRRNIYTIEMVTKLCERIANGESLRKICESDDMPSKPTATRWLVEPDKDEFRKLYDAARLAQADLYFDEIIEIADDGTRDYQVGADGKEAIDHDHVQRSRLRVDARKWAIARMNRTKYGERVDNRISGPDGGNLTFNIVRVERE